VRGKWTILAVAALLVSAPAPAASPDSARPGDAIDETRSIVSKWAATQEIVFRERKAWQQEKEILVARIELVEREIADLERKLEDSRKAAAEASATYGGLLRGKEEVARSAATLSERLAGFEAEVRKLRPVLPEPLREKVDPLYRRVPEDPATTKVSLAERFQNVLGILNEINRLHGEITLTHEIRPLSDGKPSEVKTVYVGLGQAFYVSASGEAGVGRPGPEGWQWRPANELARNIGTMIQILQNKAKPVFVSLPVEIR
jgi:hypothetical protein